MFIYLIDLHLLTVVILALLCVWALPLTPHLCSNSVRSPKCDKQRNYDAKDGLLRPSVSIYFTYLFIINSRKRSHKSIKCKNCPKLANIKASKLLISNIWVGGGANLQGAAPPTACPAKKLLPQVLGKGGSAVREFDHSGSKAYRNCSKMTLMTPWYKNIRGSAGGFFNVGLRRG